jgi:DnaK suppressor protein
MSKVQEKYNKKKLEMFEKILVEKRGKVVKELEYLENTSIRDNETAGGYTSHMSEEGSDFSLMETNFDLIQRESKFLVYIEEALERIHHKTFGICKVCDKLIEEERLMAVPTTSTHVDCKKKVKVKEQVALEKEKAKQALAKQQSK